MELHHQTKAKTINSKVILGHTLSLRIKDDLIAPAPVFVWSGGDRWKQIGTIGGRNDHWWKTGAFRVGAADRRINNGTFVFKIGVNAYSPSIKGELNIDRIQLSTSEDRSLFPADRAGLWPVGPKTKFADLGETMELIPGRGPLFLYGVYSGGWVQTAVLGPRPARAQWIAGRYSKTWA